EVRPSDFGDRVVKRFGNIPESKPTNANNIGSFAAENGASSKGAVGEGSEWIAASEGGDGLGSGEAHADNLGGG
ncbi:MAG: hypothetical protein WCA27_13470, partial [Candidatus Sulfotelmatobacter sp.]